ncbi:MAG: hypothetical protein WCX94_02115 [Candidatus Dojkabacteria bacterium]
MKKFNKTLFFSVLFITFFFLSNNSYAAQDGAEDSQEGKIRLESAYQSTIESWNIGQGATEADEYSAPRSGAVSTVSLVNNALLTLDPSISPNYDKMLESENISYDAKRGFLGMSEDGVYAMYESQPFVNVYAHLADEWLPGYQASSTIYAAPSGYESLVSTGISSIWSQVRNITYVFFILIMLVVGFMIMFRSKLGGQTLVTLGNTLPNIILALIGVTFSFAIAGIIIDLGGVIMAILADLFNGIFEQSNGYAETIKLGSIGDIFKAFVPQGLWNDINPLNLFKSNTGGKGLLGLLGGAGIIATIIGASNPVTLGAGLIVGLPLLLIVLAILGVATVGVFKVFITLVKAYIGILISVITGPLQIAVSAMPGKSANFINWMKGILRNVLIYPIVFAILNLPGAIYSLSGGKLSLPGPEKLTLSENSMNLSVAEGGDSWSSLLIMILQIIVLFLASNADKYAQAIIPPTSSKEAGFAAEGAKKALGGIPLLGKMLAK